jgi:hypothetical protein
MCFWKTVRSIIMILYLRLKSIARITAVDKALNAAERGEWKFRVNVSLQQSNKSDCGAFVLYNAFYLSYGINPRAYLSRKSVTILGRRTILEPSTPHIGKGVANAAQAATIVYI